MPTAKSTKKTVSKKVSKVNQPEISEVTNSQIDAPKGLPIVGNLLSNRRNLIIVLVIVTVVALLVYKRSLFIAAMVNNQPITNIELQQRLNQQYRTQLLNQMVNEKILEQEAAKKGIFITPKQLSDKVAETENQYGGAESFNMLLSQQGLSRDEFTKQIKYQLLVEELYKSDITPTDQDINQYMDANKNDPQATDEAKFKETAQKAIKQQKLGQIFNQKFQELKQAAKVQIF